MPRPYEVQVPMDLLEFARCIPKVDLHVHLEGSIRPTTLLELARRNDVPLPAQDEASLQAFYQFKDFAHFIQVYLIITACLQHVDDYRLAAYEFGRDCASQNIRYAEVTFSVLTNARVSGLPWQDILTGLNAGREQARDEFGVDWRWVFDIVRDLPGTQQEVLEVALAARDWGVVALGLGGSERGFPPGLFVKTFERALQAGLARVPHAGELEGPDSIRAAIDCLHADRIGHGVRCIEDPALVEFLRQQQIPLEICPTSNVRLGIFPDYASHPLRRLWDAGLSITVNSDDPPMFGTNLAHEFEILVESFQFTADELARISLNGVRCSFLPNVEKQRLEHEFRHEIARLRESILKT
jgi:aminodeoxyfutalosine deaminase